MIDGWEVVGAYESSMVMAAWNEKGVILSTFLVDGYEGCVGHGGVVGDLVGDVGDGEGTSRLCNACSRSFVSLRRLRLFV